MEAVYNAPRCFHQGVMMSGLKPGSSFGECPTGCTTPPKINSLAEVVVADPLLTTAPLPLLPLAPDVTSNGDVVFMPVYSNIRISGKAAAWLKVTDTVFSPPEILFA